MRHGAKWSAGRGQRTKSRRRQAKPHGFLSGRLLRLEVLETRSMLSGAAGFEFRANSYTTGDQEMPVAASDAAGDFVLAWFDGQRGATIAQRYNSVSVPQGGEITVASGSFSGSPAIAMDNRGDFAVAVNESVYRFDASGNQLGGPLQFTTNSTEGLTLAMDAAGDMLVAWRGRDAQNDTGIYAQRYDSSGGAQGGVFLVNTNTTAGEKTRPSAAMDAAGDFVITWTSNGQDGSDYGIFAQRYNAAGVPQAAEFKVNFTTPGAQRNSSIAMDAAGDYVIAWDSQGQDGSGYGIFAQRFNAVSSGQGVEFQVNTFTTSSQIKPRAAIDASGDFTITWESLNQDGSDYGIYARSYNAAGIAQSGEFQVNSYTTSGQVNPAVAMDSAGDLVIAWESYVQDSGTRGIYVRCYVAGAGPELAVNTYTSNTQVFSNVASDSAGDFVITWQSYGEDGDKTGIYARRYNAAGVPQGGEFRVNTYTTGYQTGPVVAMDSAGDFVIAWTSPQDGSGNGVYAQRYNATGQAQGGEFLVNIATTGGQSTPSIAMDSAGDFLIAYLSIPTSGTYDIEIDRFDSAGNRQSGDILVHGSSVSTPELPTVAMDSAGDAVVAWESYGQDASSSWGIYAQRLDSNDNFQGGEFLVDNYTVVNQIFPRAAMDAAGDFVIAWQSSGQDGSGYGIYARRYNAGGTAQGQEFLVNSYTTGNQTSVGVAMDSLGDFVVSWNGAPGHADGTTPSNAATYFQAYDANGTPRIGQIATDTYSGGVEEYSAVAMDFHGDFVVTWSSIGQDGSGYGVFAQRYNSLWALTINGSPNETVNVTFNDATDFAVDANGASADYTTDDYHWFFYNGPNAFSQVVFSDDFDTFDATQSLSSTHITDNGPTFEFDATNTSTLYVYAGIGSSASINVAGGSGANFFVGDAPGVYSYIADPIAGIYSELSGFAAETVTGSGGQTYAYVYSTTDAQFVGDPGGSSFSLSGFTSTVSNFPQEYVVGSPDGKDSVTLHSAGGAFVATPSFTYAHGGADASAWIIGALYAASVSGQSSGAPDQAYFYSYPSNTFTGGSGAGSLVGGTTNVNGAAVNFQSQANGYSAITVFVSGSGTDVANLNSPGGGLFSSTGTYASLTVGSNALTVITAASVNGNFVPVPSQVVVTGKHDGSDSASLYDAAGSNTATASGSTAKLSNANGSITVNQFGKVQLIQEDGSSDTLHQDAIDFTLSTVGNWTSV